MRPLTGTYRAKLEVIMPVLKTAEYERKSRRFQAAGLNGSRLVRKTIISRKNHKARVEWAKFAQGLDQERVGRCRQIHVAWYEWDKVESSSPTTLFDHQVPDPKMKHGGGNVMVWGYVSQLGMGPLRRIKGIMEEFQYKDILRHAILLVVASFSNRIIIRSTDPSTSRTGSPAVM
ncbi:hypothetical protein AVEN_135208-1 [Araneus ventricosus]|uniref:Uncharacterized protein n=1 Tax=Araneus ventricosus TaxID=182803 RepID=A0A4Y2QQB9_ARAVE|nr:hypothetical protein AVEN_135208-1 [Araneus ventricosus]